MGGTPLFTHLHDRLAAAGCTDVRVVTRPEKEDVIALAEEHRATVVRGHPPTLADSLALGLAGVADEAIVLVGFPDSVWLPRDGFRPLVGAVRAGAAAALGLFRVDEPWRSDVPTLDAGGRVVDIAVKPERPASPWIWGILAGRAGALRGIGDHAWPSEHLRLLARRAHVVGVRLSESYLDVGTPAALAAAEAWVTRHAAVG